MKEITNLLQLQTIAGGHYSHSYDRYITENVIRFECTMSGLVIGLCSSMLGILAAQRFAPTLLPGFAVIGAAAGFYLGYTTNSYYNLEPNQWISVDMHYV